MKKTRQRIVRVALGRTINMGNYESTRVELTADVFPGEDFLEVLERLKDEVWEIESQVKGAKGRASRPY